MKDHKQIKRSVSPYDLEGPIEKTVEFIKERSEGLLKPEIEVEPYGYDGGIELYVVGWVPMTEKEKAAAARQRERDRAAAEHRAQKEAARDREKLRTLAKKLGVEIVDKT